MTAENAITVSATGDSLFVARLPDEYVSELEKVRAVLGKTDVRITNLETNLGPFGDFASAYSGGTWLNTTEDAFADLTRYGFNYYGTANNHTMDYSYHGLLSTMEILKKNRLAFSGTGNSLEEAGSPAVLRTPAGSVGIIAVTATYHPASKAGNPSLGSKARPGVNYVGCRYVYPVSADELEQLKKIADHCGINEERNREIAGGFALPDPEGVFTLGSTKFTANPDAKTSSCVPEDLARLKKAVRDAKEKYGLVLVLVHSHESGGKRSSDVPEFLQELDHACVDAGASAVIGGGEHALRPMEIYNGAPIFYSLGDFIYQGMEVPYLPADFMEKYGIAPDSTAWEGLMARSKNGKIGLQANRRNYLTVLPQMKFTREGKLLSLRMIPIDLGFEKPGKMKGLPCVASDAVGREICGILSAYSEPYGTKLRYENGCILPDGV